jgi:hypothetical protein
LTLVGAALNECGRVRAASDPHALEFADATPHPTRSARHLLPQGEKGKDRTNSLIQFGSNFSQFTNNR